MPPGRARGFSLIEVIAALLLLAITFTALMKVAGGAIGLTQRAAQRSEAAMWAHSLLDSAFVIEPLRAGTRSGTFDKHYRWQLQVTPWNPAGQPAPNAALQLYQLDLDVRWHGNGHDQVAHFSTLRLGVPGAGAGP
ncbi:type IV pilus modification PilV family protein [Dyella sp. KRB-257]|uniref:type IV pilus modification PilV family protein n=1 Tax=Dyella sp. KRB-257 TaxID=3400915 RepID=UPI003C11E044